MRPYRGLTKDGNWVYGWYYHNHYVNEHKIFVCKDHSTFDVFDVIPETVGQQVGLKDKNGKEIYKGDIIQSGKRLVIDWDTYNACWGTYNKKNEREFGLGSWSLDRFEIIGNIHQNPELMEKK